MYLIDVMNNKWYQKQRYTNIEIKWEKKILFLTIKVSVNSGPLSLFPFALYFVYKTFAHCTNILLPCKGEAEWPRDMALNAVI